MPQSARILTTACPTPAVPLEDCQREYGGATHSTFQQKIQVYRAVIVPTLLYGAETWDLYRKQIRLLERFHQRCLRSILSIKWQDYVSNEEVLKRASLPSKESIFLQVQLCWAGHITRMEDIHMPKAVFFNKSKKESACVMLQESITKIS